MTIKKKLQIIICLFALLGIIFIALNFWMFHAFKESIANNEVLDRVVHDSYQLTLLTEETLRFPKEKRPKEQWENKYQKMEEVLKSPVFTEFYMKDEAERLQYSFRQIRRNYYKLLDTLTPSANQVHDELLDEQRERINDRILIDTQAVASHAKILSNNFNKRLLLQVTTLNYTTIVLILLATGVLLVFSIFMMRGIFQALSILHEGVGHVAKGNLSHRVSFASHDELGEFAQAFNNMIAQLENTMESRDKLGELVNERTVAVEKSRIAAISVMEDVALQKKMLTQAKEELEREIQAHKETENELRNKERMLEEAKNVADAANKAKSIFLASMSHELRTPMNAILGYTQLLQRDKGLPEDVKEKVNTISRSGSHLLDIINDVLEISKIEAGKITLHSVTFNLPSLFSDLESMFRVRTEKKGLKLHYEYDGFPVYISTDEGKLRQILINLLGNSVKFTQKGHISMVAKTENIQDQLWLNVIVEDTGVGIPVEDQQKLFSAFVQLGNAPEQAGGTGLGLSITKKYVEQMGGSITVQSQAGKGSVFQVKIPVEIGSIADIKSKKGQKNVLELKSGDAYSVLIVDDNQENLNMLANMLDLPGFTVYKALNGEEALEVFTDKNPDIVYMDLKMPKMDGYQTTRKIRFIKGGKKVPIIAVSASVLDDVKERIMECGADDYLRKPVDNNELLLKTAKWLKLEAVFEQPHETSKKSDNGIDHDALQERIQALPDSLKEDIAETAVIMDINELKGKLATVETLDSELAQTLEKYALNFEWEKIIDLMNNK